jgi:hypothetical protein
MNDQHPLERDASHRRQPLPSAFVMEAREIVPASEDYRLEPAKNGLRIHAASETALETPVGRLREAYGDDLLLMPVRVKYRRHDNVDYAPVMFVRTQVRAGAQPFVRSSLRARGAEILEEDIQGRTVVTRAVASLSRLLGFPASLGKIAGDDSRHWIWLSHYAPIDSGGDAA